jgi:3-deoxy-manno-octulosonate cytidylyltransferase (CMP-KDO synthetase)
MNNTVIIIPTRLEAKRFPNKPIAKINNIPMIIHVLNRAQESKVGKVFVATPDNEIINLVRANGGEAILTNNKHKSGSDRIYEAYLKELINESNIDLIINLQGDMPNIKPNSIKKLQKFMRLNDCDIGTLASNINDKNEINDPNVVKVEIEKKLKDDNFCQAKDFFRKKKNLSNEKIYHHIGIYAFTNIALTKYVGLARSKLEIDRNLEQMRAMENNLIIKVALCDSTPLGIDTQEDLLKVQKEMRK